MRFAGSIANDVPLLAACGALALLAGCNPPPNSAVKPGAPAVISPREREQAGRRPDYRAPGMTVVSKANPGNDLEATGPFDDDEQRTEIRAALNGIIFNNDAAGVDREAVRSLGGPDAAESARATANADTARTSHRLVDAVRYRTIAVLRAPDSADATERLGAALDDVAFCSEAAAVYRRALQLDPALRNSRYQLGLCCQKTGRLDEAELQWSELVRRYPDHADGHARLAVMAFFLEHDADAWVHVHAAESLGRPVPAHFRANLAERTAEPQP